MSDGYVYNESKKNVLIPEGDYEVSVDKIERKVTGAGREKLVITFRLRSDVEQEFKNRCIFEDIWSEKDNPKFFNRKRINQLLGTQKGMKEGMTFGNINKIIKFLLNRSLVCHIGVEFDTYREKDVNVVNYYRSSKVEPLYKNLKTAEEIINESEEQPQQQNVVSSNNLPVVNDDDLPF